MTVPRLQKMQAEWRRRPPVAQLVAGFLKYTPPAEDLPGQSPAPSQRATIAGLKAAFPNGRI